MTTYFIIANPTAGHRACEKAIPKVEKILEKHGASYQIVQTEDSWHGFELAREAAAGFDVVVALGGDGTANERRDHVPFDCPAPSSIPGILFRHGKSDRRVHCPGVNCQVDHSSIDALGP
ncbi:MAG: diacylglycerol kinase family protein [Candidatus Promineifilaceae bacterium]